MWCTWYNADVPAVPQAAVDEPVVVCFGLCVAHNWDVRKGNHFVYVICKTAYIHNLALTLSVHQYVHHPVCVYVCVCKRCHPAGAVSRVKLKLHFLKVYSPVVYLCLIASLFCFLLIYSYISSSQKRQSWKVVNLLQTNFHFYHFILFLKCIQVHSSL